MTAAGRYGASHWFRSFNIWQQEAQLLESDGHKNILDLAIASRMSRYLRDKGQRPIVPFDFPCFPAKSNLKGKDSHG